MNGNKSFKWLFICGSSAIAIAVTSAQPALANPAGGNVVAGDATISSSGNNVNITQNSNRAVINWDSFNIGVNETTRFQQPSSNAIILNRVKSNNPSNIAGNIQANGNVVLVNPNGVVFAKTAKVDVNGLIATTSDVNDSEFMNGGALRFTKPGNPNAIINNKGTITAKEAGLVGLVAPNVLNSGVITAKLGKVHLASGDVATIDLYGDGLINLQVSDNVHQQIIANAGSVRAEGGVITLSAAAGSQIVNSMITVEGMLDASTLGVHEGKVSIYAEGSHAVKNNVTANKDKKTGSSSVVVRGVINASGLDAGERGGSVEVLADNVALMSGTVISASGYNSKLPTASNSTGSATMKSDGTVRTEADFLAHENRAGGTIKIGGDYLGQGTTAAAKKVYVESGAFILNDAIKTGDAGRTIFWSDGNNTFAGAVFARGGSENGNGGFLETSGHEQLNALGYADLSAAKGNKGTYFLDPSNITILGGFDPSDVTGLSLWLDAADESKVIVSYINSALSTVTTNGTSGSHTINANMAVDGVLMPGVRIRLGGAGTDGAANTLGANTYTIASVSGGVITTVEALSTNYAGSALYYGVVKEWDDKSAANNHAYQNTASSMPFFIAKGVNTNTSGNNAIFGNGTQYMSTLNGLSQGNSSIYTALNVKAVNGMDGILTTGAAQDTNPYLYLQMNGTTLRMYNEGAPGHEYLSAGTVTLQSNTLFNEITNGTTRAVYLNGQQTGTDNNFTVPGSGTLSPIQIMSGFGGQMNGWMYEVLAYNTPVSAGDNILLSQYMAAKWGMTLVPPGTGVTEADKAMAGNGYSTFTVAYLEHLSQNANISLQATNGISLDMKGETLSLANGRNITLTTTNGNIATLSDGTIQTDNGNIIFNANGSGNINISHDLTLDAANGGHIEFNTDAASGGDITISGDVNWSADYFNLHADAGTITVNNPIVETTNSTSAILEMKANDFDFNAAVTGKGELDIINATNARTMGIGDGAAGNTNIDSNSLSNITNGWNEIVFNSDDGNLEIASQTWLDNVTFNAALGTLNIIGTQNFGANNAKIGGRNTVTFGAPLIGTGTLTIMPQGAAGVNLDIGDLAISSNHTGAPNRMKINNASLNTIQNGWGAIQFVTNGSGIINFESATPFNFSDPVEFISSGETYIRSDIGFTASSNGSFSAFGLYNPLSSTYDATDILQISGRIDTTNALSGQSYHDITLLKLDGAELVGGDHNIDINNTVAATQLLDDSIINAGNATFTLGTGGLDLNSKQATLRADTITLNGNLTGTGDLVLNTDHFTGGAHLATATGNSLTFTPYTLTHAMGVGSGGAENLIITNALVAQIQTGFNSYIWGDAAGGNITNHYTSWDDDVTFLSAHDFFNNATVSAADKFWVVADGDITLNNAITANSSTNALVLSASGNFINHAGAGALSASSSRWIVYSTDPALNIISGLTGAGQQFSKTFALNAPASIAAGNQFVYAIASTGGNGGNNNGGNNNPPPVHDVKLPETVLKTITSGAGSADANSNQAYYSGNTRSYTLSNSGYGQALYDALSDEFIMNIDAELIFTPELKKMFGLFTVTDKEPETTKEKDQI